jgi:hypothetical protein
MATTTTAAPLFTPRRHHSAFSIGVAVLALAGVPAIWLPFAYHTSPASALFEHGFFNLWPLAWPSLLAVPIAAALFKWVASGRLSSVERWSGRLLAAASCCVTGWFYVRTILEGDWPSGASEWFGFSVLIVILTGGAALAVRALRSGLAPDGLDAVVMMEVAYLANAVWCLLSFGDDLEIGGYAVLLTSVVYGVQLLAVQLSRPTGAEAAEPAAALSCSSGASRPNVL